MNESQRNDNLGEAGSLRDNLHEKYAELVLRSDELMDAGATWLQVTSEEEAKAVSDLRKAFLKLGQHLDACRKSEKEPFAALARAVDGWFMPKQDKLKAELIRLNGIEISYLQMKEAAERRRREEEAARLRKEAEARLAVAQEEEAKRLAARNPNSPPPKTAIEQAMVAAMAADEAASKAEKAALAKPAELSRTRGDLGSVSSLRRRWTGELTDRSRLDLEALRDHFPTDALNQAIRSWVKAHSGDEQAPPELKGARIYQATSL